jgi:magnesium chelatase family protein
LVDGIEVHGARTLRQAQSWLNGKADLDQTTRAEPVEYGDEPDLADVIGQPQARFAVEVAAAGAHHLMLSGPKGAGKTTLAERIPGILPDLSLDESLELTAVHSLAGCLEPGDGRIVRPPYGAPHSSSTRASLLGGGSGRVRPGEISRAHCGVLFLDEFPLFNADIIEALRQPLESGDITIGRGDEVATFPARGMFVFAANPCPCGNYHPHAGRDQCTCPPQRLRDYRRKLEGPVLDRIDITRHVEPVRKASRGDLDDPPESTAVVRARVEAARDRQLERFAGEEWRTNSQIPGPALSGTWHLTRAATKRLDSALLSGRITRRGATRVQRVAWTVADLAGRERPGLDELDTALRLRTGAPLVLSLVRRRRAG